MLKAGIIFETGLILDGRKQIFITPAVILHPEQFLEPKEEYQKLAEQLDEWTKRNLTTETWQILKKGLNRHEIPPPIVNIIEIRLFPSLMKQTSTKIEYCYICKTENARNSCNTCKNLICKTHEHEIDRESEEAIILCPNCVEKFFG